MQGACGRQRLHQLPGLWTIGKAIEYSAQLAAEKPELYSRLDQKLGLADLQGKWAVQQEKIFLTQPNENGVLPQDSTYLTLRDIDLSKYKKQAHVGGIYKDYNQEQITKIQVSKQADVIVLFLQPVQVVDDFHKRFALAYPLYQFSI